jgi:hypothetical protein
MVGGCNRWGKGWLRSRVEEADDMHERLRPPVSAKSGFRGCFHSPLSLTVVPPVVLHRCPPAVSPAGFPTNCPTSSPTGFPRRGMS